VQILAQGSCSLADSFVGPMEPASEIWEGQVRKIDEKESDGGEERRHTAEEGCDDIVQPRSHTSVSLQCGVCHACLQHVEGQ